jgi:hypothetical protein
MEKSILAVVKAAVALVYLFTRKYIMQKINKYNIFLIAFLTSPKMSFYVLACGIFKMKAVKTILKTGIPL